MHKTPNPNDSICHNSLCVDGAGTGWVDTQKHRVRQGATESDALRDGKRRRRRRRGRMGAAVEKGKVFRWSLFPAQWGDRMHRHAPLSISHAHTNLL